MSVRILVKVILVQMLGKYMIIRYLDPRANLKNANMKPVASSYREG